MITLDGIAKIYWIQSAHLLFFPGYYRMFLFLCLFISPFLCSGYTLAAEGSGHCYMGILKLQHSCVEFLVRLRII